MKLLFYIICGLLSTQSFGQASVCATPAPAPDALCTPPSSFDVNVVATGTQDWLTLTGVDPANVTNTIQITGTGTVVVNNITDLLLTTPNAVIYINGPTLIVDDGNLGLVTSGARFIMQGGTLRTSGNFQQTGNTLICITGTEIEIGEENANGIFNSRGQLNTAANWQNDGGYRYLNGVCVNVTQDYQLSSTGTGQGINGRDVILNSCFEIGDRGANHANATPFQQKDGDDSGNWQNNRRQFIYNTNIILANGNFQNSLDTMTVCNVGVKVNVTGRFQVNSGYLIGDGLCLGVEDVIENSHHWAANVSAWYSFTQSQIFQHQPITGTIPATEATESAILTGCFPSCCASAARCPTICLPVTATRN